MKQAYMQPIVFSSRNRKRRKRLSKFDFFWIRVGLGAVLVITIYLVTK